MNFEYDVVVIGAGPVGSTVAYYLAQNNLKIAIIEKKTQIGYPLQCAGILSAHIHELNELPSQIILNEVKGSFIHSKKNNLKIEKDTTVAYVINRIAYDNFLLNRAVNSGAELINKKAVSFDISKGIVYLNNNEEITAKIIVGCDGYNSKLSKYINNKQRNFNAFQCLVEIDNIEDYQNCKLNNDDYVDLFMCEKLLPGFLWIIPLKNNLYRVGLFSMDSHKKQKEFIKDFLDERFTYEIKEKYKGFIPVYDKNNHIVKDNVLLIGDAASQIKPTSGGGLLLAFDACKIASKYIIQAINEDDTSVLKKYEDDFLNKYSKELNYQIKVQKAFRLLSDDDIEFFFKKLKINDCEKIISQYGDMDEQSILVKEFIKKGLIFKILPSFMLKKVLKIFGLR